MTANYSQTPCGEINFIDLSRFAMPLRRMSGNRYRRAIQKRRRIFGGVTNESGVSIRPRRSNSPALAAAPPWPALRHQRPACGFAGYEYRLFDSGGGCFPSVADREAYPTRDDAIRAITDDLRFVFLRTASISGNPENIRTHAQKMFEMLKARLDPPAQFDLFAPEPPDQGTGTMNIQAALALCHCRWIGPNVTRVAMRQIEREEVGFLLDPADHHQRFAEISLGMVFDERLAKIPIARALAAA